MPTGDLVAMTENHETASSVGCRAPTGRFFGRLDVLPVLMAANLCRSAVSGHLDCDGAPSPDAIDRPITPRHDRSPHTLRERHWGYQRTAEIRYRFSRPFATASSSRRRLA